ncbi:hypothetical protein BCR35DRAFT_277208 [Leucosporidium creatinivorum]|uniref:FAD-binding domain-containing protein n=1 Tax=Leucosporidium creatinivorum TaxID=106004 RepID=A0A1Y2FY88_9BASI|nr:hypothetical protein BCR35DRAFT_277208 [Leucosporidium creatinivorum]
MSTPPLRVAIVGGGIAGLAAAQGFLKLQQDGANIEINVYESATKFAEIGAGVSFGPNAQRALRMMGAGDALDLVAGPADDYPDVWFDFVVGEAGEQSGDMICKVRGKNAARGNVHRADFLDQLIKRVPESIAHFKHRCTGYKPHSEGVTLQFADGTSAEADVLVASDGIKSSVRRAMYERKGLDLQKQQAVYSEWVAWRGLIPRAKYEEVWGKGGHNKLMLCGDKKHILTFPVRGGDLINIVGFVQDLDHSKLGDRTGPWSEDRPKEEMLSDYANFDKKSLTMLEAIEKPSVWGIWWLPKIDSCIDDRTVIIGDASHATTPHQGAGAGQALEDALFIANILSAPSVASAPLPQRASAIQHALEVYQRARHDRGSEVAKTSREAGLLYEFCGVKGEGNDLKKMGDNLRTRMNWIWDHPMEQELQAALDALEA